MSFRLQAFMNRFRAPVTRSIIGETVVLDNLRLHGAHLENCTVVYGGSGGEIIHSVLFNCNFRFLGPAKNTLDFLKGIDQNGGGNIIGKVFPGAILHDRKEN